MAPAPGGSASDAGSSLEKEELVGIQMAPEEARQSWEQRTGPLGDSKWVQQQEGQQSVGLKGRLSLWREGSPGVSQRSEGTVVAVEGGKPWGPTMIRSVLCLVLFNGLQMIRR